MKIENQDIHFFGTEKGGYGCKFNRIMKLGKVYHELEKKFDGFMNTSAITWRWRSALAIKLMMQTGIRIGNENSAVGYESKREGVGVVKTFGLTTLTRDHIKFVGKFAKLEFTGKRCIEQSITIKDSKTVNQLKKLVKLTNSDKLFDLTEYEVRKFVWTYVGNKFCVKDFRTLRANIEAWKLSVEIMESEYPETKKELNAEIKTICEKVSKILGNTPAITKRSYIDVRLLENHLTERW